MPANAAVLTPLDEVIRKFWAVGYAGLDEREQRILAYAYTATTNVVTPRGAAREGVEP